MGNKYIKLDLPGVSDAHNELSSGSRKSIIRVGNPNMGKQVISELVSLRLQDQGMTLASKKSEDPEERRGYRRELRRMFTVNSVDMLADKPPSRARRGRLMSQVEKFAGDQGKNGLLIVRGLNLGSWITSEHANPGTALLRDLVDMDDGPSIALMGGGRLPKVRPMAAERDLPASPRSIFQEYPGVLIMRYGADPELWGYPESAIKVIHVTPPEPIGQNSSEAQPSPYPDLHQGYSRIP